MSLREQILSDIQMIQHPKLLNQIFEYLQIIKKNSYSNARHRETVLKYAGIISDADASEMLQIIENEFNQIEGDW